MCRIILLIICSILLLIPRCVATDDKKDTNEEHKDEAEKEETKKKDQDPKENKSPAGTWVPAFVYRNEDEYEKYDKSTTIHAEEPFKDLLQTIRSLGDVIVFEEQCVNDKEYSALKIIADNIQKRIIVVDWNQLKDPLHRLMENIQGHNFSDLSNTTSENMKKVIFPYMTLKRNELQISSNTSKANLIEQVTYFIDSSQHNYDAFKSLVTHYTWIRFHMHDWPSAQKTEDRTKLQKKNFEVVFNNLPQMIRKKKNSFLIYTSEKTYCDRAQLKNPKEIWDMKDKRYGSTTIWCRTNHILLQIADLTVLYPNEILVKPTGARYCDTTVFREHMVVVMKLESYSTDLDLLFDIRLPSSKNPSDQRYRTYTVERAYLRLDKNRKYQGKEFMKRVKVGSTFYNKHNRILLIKGCPANGGLVLGTIGLEYLPSDNITDVRESFANKTAKRIVFRVEKGLQNHCRIKAMFDWMAFAKKITVIMILTALPLVLFLALCMLVIRFRFQLYRCAVCTWGLMFNLWKRSKPAVHRTIKMAQASPQTLRNTVHNVRYSDVTYGCYKTIMLLHPKTVAYGCRASGRGVASFSKRLCTPVGHLIGIGAYLLQRFIYDMCVKFGGIHPEPGHSFAARLGRAREYAAQHIGNLTIYFIQGIVTISVVRAIALIATTLLEIS